MNDDHHAHGHSHGRALHEHSDANHLHTAYIYVPLLTGSLSVIGSGAILHSIWANRSTKLKNPQHRILGMMSLFNMPFSINKALTFLTYPSGLDVPTFGNEATCSMQGFFTQFGYAAASYNMVLCIYYYLSINRGMKREQFEKVWEKVMHGIVVICHLSFAITGASIGLFNPTPGFCYISPAPHKKCYYEPDIPCTRFEKSAVKFAIAFGQIWIQLGFMVIVVTNTLICLFVRRQEKEMEKYRTRSVAADQLSDMEKKSSYAKSVFIQSILYVGAFLLCWLSTGFYMWELRTGEHRTWMPLIVSIFNPLQGFFNAFIYARPRYLRLKKQNRHMGFKLLIKLVFLPDNERGGTRTPVNGSNLRLNESADQSKKRSNMFRSFLISLTKKETAVSETEGGKDKANTRSESKPMQDADEEVKSGEGEETNRDVSAAEDEEEKVEEGELPFDVDDEFLALDTESPNIPVVL